MGYGPKDHKADVTQRFVCPPERSILVPLDEILADFKGDICGCCASCWLPTSQLGPRYMTLEAPSAAELLLTHAGRLNRDQHDDFDYITQMLEALAQLNYVTIGRLDPYWRNRMRPRKTNSIEWGQIVQAP